MIQSSLINCRDSIDFDLHGLVGIRLIGASEADVRAVTRQLGPIHAKLDSDPDVVVRFVDRLPLKSSVRYLGVDEAGFTDDAFLVLRSKYKSRARVQIPFDSIGKGCEIVCESGLPAVPLLLAIVNLTALANGAVPLHASAFSYEGTGALVTGWSKGGKTETLLGFMAHGAEYVGDEWIYIDQHGEQLYGIPEPIRIWDWHLAELPAFRSTVALKDRARMKALGMFAGSMDRAASSRLGRHVLPTTVMNRLIPLLNRQRYVQMPPKSLFGDGVGSLRGTLDKIMFVVSHDSPEVVVEPIDPQEIVDRMIFSLQEERRDLMSYYWMYRFAFPDRSNKILEEAETIERELLSKLLADKEAFVIYHPYPVPIPTMYDAIRPLLSK